MAIFRQQKRHIPAPQVHQPNPSANPLFTEEAQWVNFRSRVFTYTGLTFLLIALGYVLYGPWFSIRTIPITGTRLLDPASVERVTRAYLKEQRWLILPQRTLWTLSTKQLKKILQQKINERISIEDIAIVKKYPHTLAIKITERTPVAIWTNGPQFGSIDKQGKIIEIRTQLDTALPTIHDVNGNMFAVDSSVVKQDVITAIKTIAGEMKQANITVSEYLIPVPSCLQTLPPSIDANANSSSTTQPSLINTNSSSQAKTTNISEPPALSPACDLMTLRFNSHEIHAQLPEGPKVFFDRQGDLHSAVQALKRVLSERQNKVYTTIDVRFGERVYIQ